MAGRIVLGVLLVAFSFRGVKTHNTSAHNPGPDVSAQSDDWTWCITDDSDRPICDSMVSILQELDPDFAHNYSCIIGTGAEDCMKKIRGGHAKFGVFDGGAIRTASKIYKLKPIRIQITGTSTNKYYSVGIVKKAKCPKSLADLKGKRSCHSGYARSAGWIIPVSYLVDNKIMPVHSISTSQNDINSVITFFSKTCAASDDNTKSICSACNQTSLCTDKDIYTDYDGSFRGLVEDACDVTFTKHSIPAENALGGPNAHSDWVGLEPAAAYAILCPTLLNGKLCADVEDYSSCNFGSAPPHTIFVPEEWPEVEVKKFQAVMDDANDDPEFNSLFFEGKNKEGVIFVSDATRTQEFTGTAEELVGPLEKSADSLQAINAMKASNEGAAHIDVSTMVTIMVISVSCAVISLTM